jgi:hypothetical protein
MRPASHLLDVGVIPSWKQRDQAQHPPRGVVEVTGKGAHGLYASREVYAIETRSERLLARIPVGPGHHGLCVYPQPGRCPPGHTGVLR